MTDWHAARLAINAPIICCVIYASVVDVSSNHRCSGDFSQYQQTKYCMSLPGLPSNVIDKLASSPTGLPGMTEAERAVAAQPGMFGRIVFAQALAFDEAYQILMDQSSLHIVGYMRRLHVLCHPITY